VTVHCHSKTGQTKHFLNYTVSQKTSHLWLAITLTYTTRLW